MSYLDITFTGRNPFSEAEVAAGVAAAYAVFAGEGVTPDKAHERNMRAVEDRCELDALWERADYAAAQAMCGAAGCGTGAAENASLELIGGGAVE